MTQIILHNAFSFYQEGFLKSFNQFIEYRHARFFLNEKMKLSKWEDKDMTKEIMNAMNTQIFGVWFPYRSRIGILDAGRIRYG